MWLTTRNKHTGKAILRYASNYEEYDPIERLCKYEETGFHPEALEQCAKMLGNINILQFYEWLKANNEGRLVVLPCKVGDSFFTYSWICSASNDDYQRDCGKYNECNECPYNSYEIKEWKFKNAAHILNAEETFGKSIFLSREEVEAATRGENNDD